MFGLFSFRLRPLNFLLYWQSGELIWVWSVDKIIIKSLSFRVGTSKNKNTDHRFKESCATMSTQVRYETY